MPINIYAMNLDEEDFPVPAPGGRKARTRRMYGRIYYAFVALAVGLLAALFTLNVFVLLAGLLTTLCIAAYLGFQALGEYQVFNNTPVSKIDGAIDGLCEIQARFEPEAGTPETNPVTGEPCLCYRLELHYKTGGKNSVDYVEWSHEAGTRCILDDGTGYMYGDYRDAEVGYCENIYPIHDRKWLDLKRKGEIMDLMDSTTPDGRLDLQRFSSTINIDSSIGNEPSLKSTSMTRHLAPGGFYLLVQYMPAKIPYVVMSGITDTGKSYNGKPLKLVSADARNRVFTILPESKERAVSKLRNYSILNLGFAVLCLTLVMLVVEYAIA